MMDLLTYNSGIFKNLGLLAIFTHFAKLKKGGMKIKKNLLLSPFF
jgi:hypothetical protein